MCCQIRNLDLIESSSVYESSWIRNNVHFLLPCEILSPIDCDRISKSCQIRDVLLLLLPFTSFILLLSFAFCLLFHSISLVRGGTEPTSRYPSPHFKHHRSANIPEEFRVSQILHLLRPTFDILLKPSSFISTLYSPAHPSWSLNPNHQRLLRRTMVQT